jgi:hypothetical protein
MNFFLQSTEYICALKDKGYYDEGFFNEYEFLCYETFKINHPESLEEVNSIQTKKLLEREILR